MSGKKNSLLFLLIGMFLIGGVPFSFAGGSVDMCNGRYFDSSLELWNCPNQNSYGLLGVSDDNVSVIPVAKFGGMHGGHSGGSRPHFGGGFRHGGFRHGGFGPRFGHSRGFGHGFHPGFRGHMGFMGNKGSHPGFRGGRHW